MQGYWPGVAMLGVPLERPASLGDKATLTDEEFAQLPDKRRLTNANDAFFGESRDHWRDYGKPQHQTSLVVDPPDLLRIQPGRSVGEVRPWGAAWRRVWDSNPR